jgi:hypothetical protein
VAASPTSFPSRNHLSLNLRTSQINDPSDVALTAEAIARILDDPFVAPAVYSLNAGPEFAPSSCPPPPVNFLSQRKISRELEAVDVDVGRIEGIVERNPCVVSSSPSPFLSLTPLLLHSFKSNSSNTPSLFLTASHFRQQDAGNCSWKIRYDVVVLRAVRAVKKGEEVVLSRVESKGGLAA